jgi:hypothetical protein
MTISELRKKNIFAMMFVAMMTIFCCCHTPSTTEPFYKDIVISASYGGGFIMNSRTVTIYGNGKVTYDTVVVNIDFAGHKEAEISQGRVIELVNKFRDNNFCSLKDEYSCGGDVYKYISYYDPSEEKKVYGNMGTWGNDSTCQNPPEYDTLWNECWKIKQELFP